MPSLEEQQLGLGNHCQGEVVPIAAFAADFWKALLPLVTGRAIRKVGKGAA